VFFVVAVLSGFAALLVALFAHEEKGMRTMLETWSPTSVLGDVVRDFRHHLSKPVLRQGILLFFCIQFGVGATNPLMEIYVGDLWTGDPARVPSLTAWLFTAVAAAGFVASPLWGRYGDRVGHTRAVLVSVAIAALVLAGHAFAMVFAGLLVCRILIGASAGGTNATAFGLAATQTPPEQRGAAFGIVFSARAMALSIGAMSGGALASVLGIPGLFLVSGGLVGGALVALKVFGSRHAVPRPDD